MMLEDDKDKSKLTLRAEHITAKIKYLFHYLLMCK